jgi:nucleotide-binding universal stress UspA family protein
VALDQSPASEAMLECLPELKMFGTEMVTLFTAASVAHQNRPNDDEIRRWQEPLDHYAAKLMQKNGFQVATKVNYDSKMPVPLRILKTARDVGAGYIIIANRGHSKLREMLLGSTVTALLQQSNLPVFLIKLRPDTAEGSDTARLRCTAPCHDALRHILYPTDFSETARYAFEMLSRLATGPTERITLYHVQAKGQVDLTNAAQLEEYNRIDHERLQSLSRELREQAGVDVDIALSQGPAAQLIADKARSVSATMIVMGSQGRGYISDLFLGGVTYQVLRNTPVPVLVIPGRNPDTYEHQEKAWMK